MLGVFSYIDKNSFLQFFFRLCIPVGFVSKWPRNLFDTVEFSLHVSSILLIQLNCYMNRS